jgi:D-threo-aldose 1-dehydrogenase
MKPWAKSRLGRVDLDITALGLGSVPIANAYKAMSEAQADAVIGAAWDAGIRFFDTAPLYGHGLGELRLGASLRLKNRDDFVLATKVGRLLKPMPRGDIDFGAFVDAPAFGFAYDYSYDGTMRALEDSLQRLAIERIDVALIHDIDVLNFGEAQPAFFDQAMDECWRALEALRSQGIVKAIGVGVNEWQVCEAALLRCDFDCFLLAGRYTLLEQEALDSFLPLCVERNVAVVIGGGFNSGILATGAVKDARYNYAPAPAEIADRVKKIEAVCRDHAVPMPAAAMQFVLAHPAIASFVSGIRSISQLRQNLQWLDTAIPANFWRDMKAQGLIREDAPTP